MGEKTSPSKRALLDATRDIGQDIIPDKLILAMLNQIQESRNTGNNEVRESFAKRKPDRSEVED